MEPLIDHHRFQLAENLLWDHRYVCYWFIDIDAKRVYRFTPAQQQLDHWQLPETVGCLGLCDDGNLLLGLASGIYHFDQHTAALTGIGHPLLTSSKDIRYNDGRVDREGNFWFASMDQDRRRRPIASLFCLLTSGEIKTVRSGLRVGNGIAFDDTCGRDSVYFSDTRAPAIYVAERSTALAQLANDQTVEFGIFAVADDRIGRPDGGTVDSEGYYWSAGVSAGNLNRFSPDGKLIDSQALPMQAPTIPCFGGKDLMELAVASIYKSENNRPADGKIYAKACQTPGKAEYFFPWTALSSTLSRP